MTTSEGIYKRETSNFGHSPIGCIYLHISNDMDLEHIDVFNFHPSFIVAFIFTLVFNRNFKMQRAEKIAISDDFTYATVTQELQFLFYKINEKSLKELDVSLIN